MKPTWRYCFCLFHSNDPKPKRNPQIASNRATTRPTQSQTCVKFRGIFICIERNADVNTSDVKILYKKMSKYGWFSRCYLLFLQTFMWFAFNLMLDWRAMTVTVHLAPYSEGHSLSVQYYDFLSSRNTLSVTLSDTASYRTTEAFKADRSELWDMAYEATHYRESMAQSYMTSVVR